MQGRHSQRETVAFVTLIFYGPRYFTLDANRYRFSFRFEELVRIMY